MIELSFEKILENIQLGIPFSYARYGDGEWNCILQKKPGGVNCDGHHYFPDLGQQLRRIVESRPEYYLGLQRLAKEQNEGDKQFDWLVALNKWTDNEIMHRASIKGRIQEFFDALTGKNVFIIGNESLKKLPIKLIRFMEIPAKDCWHVYPTIKSWIPQVAGQGDIILYCASMMSKVLIDDHKDRGYLQIDCGSVFDPYCGRNTRTYHKNLQIK